MPKKGPTRSDRKRDLHRLAVARSDITAALEACNLLLANVHHHRHDLYQPLFHAIAISYARPFTANRPLGSLPAKWSRYTNPRFQEAHDELLSIRNQFVAHSDQDERTVQIVPPYVIVPGATTHYVTIGVGVRTVGFPVRNFVVVRRMCVDIGRRLEKAINDLLDELYKDKILPAAIFQLTIDEGL
jgi:hypothetical protein